MTEDDKNTAKKTLKVVYSGQSGVLIKSVSPRIDFRNVHTGQVLEVTEEQAEQLLRNPDFKLKEGG